MKLAYAKSDRDACRGISNGIRYVLQGRQPVQQTRKECFEAVTRSRRTTACIHRRAGVSVGMPVPDITDIIPSSSSTSTMCRWKTPICMASTINMIGFIRSLFESALKTNPYLEKGVITGCLRISKESIFTGLNNLENDSVLHTRYADSFGFTEAEVEAMLAYYDLRQELPEVKEWYDGYLFDEYRDLQSMEYSQICQRPER